MKRILVLVATVAAALTFGVSSAHATAATCSQHVGDAPTLDGGIHATYHGTCNGTWYLDARLQYESGGVWTDQFDATPFHVGPFSPGSHHDPSNLWSGLVRTPYHCFNWRTDDYWNVSTSTDQTTIHDESAVLHKVDGPDC